MSASSLRGRGDTREVCRGADAHKSSRRGADEGQTDDDATLPVEECVNKKQPTLQVVQLTMLHRTWRSV